MSTPASSDRRRLIVLFGGVSAEHDVSCVSAAHVLAAADPTKYEIIPIGVTRTGRWIRNDKALSALQERALTGGEVALPDSLEPAGTEVEPLPALQTDDLPVVVLPLLHGPHGEDGTVQGMLELSGVPYVGSGVLGSAVCMDKALAKVVAAQAGIPQCRWLEFRAGGNRLRLRRDVDETLGYPVFVKPANLGSSVGISKVHDADELESAVALALRYDEVLVIEEGVTGREIELAVLGNDDPQVSVPGEIVPGSEFYDYEDKYVNGAAGLLIPADLPAGAADEARELALRAFTALRCSGMARVDFFYEEHGRGWLLNEINTIPGFTPGSMYPKLWEASGVSYGELIDSLVDLAVDRHRVRSSFSTDH
ncbi:D-alanine--D-alanine ligase family protein [Williamsia sterculiae]|uniref:D-alanine--D-alanine ligase n=1 Tax=Williamsia sterculiae TaxID=1344003 RepID=A0A1N7FCZ8_9NOCA|nr:D-alanine--D-alanine ligase family protein [Williamsia sterculiae]SIR98184.1 D-alanine--D-alanine ligase [Williamsia sterculiae]